MSLASSFSIAITKTCFMLLAHAWFEDKSKLPKIQKTETMDNGNMRI
jgi:hypothetical protein